MHGLSRVSHAFVLVAVPEQTNIEEAVLLSLVSGVPKAQYVAMTVRDSGGRFEVAFSEAASQTSLTIDDPHHPTRAYHSS